MAEVKTGRVVLNKDTPLGRYEIVELMAHDYFYPTLGETEVIILKSHGRTMSEFDCENGDLKGFFILHGALLKQPYELS